MKQHVYKLEQLVQWM